jgi:carboxypeptidase C (cathepsin A)
MSFARSSSVVALLVARALLAQAPGDEPIVVRHHQVAIGGRTLSYITRAGRIAIRDNDAGDAHAQMFFVSYTLDRPDSAARRPMTFAWNGGPGSNAALVHLIGFGPKRIAPPPGAADDARWVVQDNLGTWLDFTDLVFVDPIGTGYSRVTKPGYMPEFYQTRGDAESVAEFIRVYRLRYDASDAPVFLAGESFGVTRAAHVADVLEQRSVTVRGVVLMGLEPPLGRLPDSLRAALALPNYTIAAHVQGKLAPELERDWPATLRQVESWSSTAYARSLGRLTTLTAVERDSVARTLSRFTGIDDSVIDRKTLVLSYSRIGTQLLRREGRVVGLYDVRKTAPLDTTPGPYDPRNDPSLSRLVDPIAVLRYIRTELGYLNDLNYQGPWGGGYPPPEHFRGDWMSVRWDWKADSTRALVLAASGSAASTPSPLEHAMMANPSRRVLVACGTFDLICDYYANEWKITHLPNDLRRRVAVKAYPGGHALYTDDSARLALKRDVEQLVRDALAEP